MIDINEELAQRLVDQFELTDGTGDRHNVAIATNRGSVVLDGEWTLAQLVAILRETLLPQPKAGDVR